MKKLRSALFALGIAFLAVLVWKVGPRELWHELTTLGWGLIPLIMGEGVAEMIHTLGWHQCLSGPLRRLSWWELFRIRMAGYAINYLTPTAAMGGEVTKGTLLTSRGGGAEATSGVLIGKLCFALAHLIFVVLGVLLVLWRVHMSKGLLVAMVVSGSAVGAGMIMFLLLQRYGKLGGIVRWLASRSVAGETLKKAAQELTAVDETMKQFYRERPFGMPLAIGWHLVGYSIGIVQTWIFFHVLGQNAGWMVASGAWFLGMWFDLLTFAVPQNLGTLEGTRVIVLQAFGYTALMGVTYGFAQRLAQLFWSCYGLINYAWLVSQNKATRTVSGNISPLRTNGSALKTNGTIHSHRAEDAAKRS